MQTSGHLPGDEDWQDLIARVSRAGIYGVTKTGIFCRFGCPSRPPLRQNLRLFDSADQASAAGFRACKRCGAP